MLRHRPIRVLIADDEDRFADLIEVSLQADERIELVGRASDGREAVELARELAPDVVVCDIEMPIMDGIEAARFIREENPSVRIVVLTGAHDRRNIVRAWEAGARAYVRKEHMSGVLAGVIVELVSGWR
jgi:two-component system nitrate/nitrite response regulator NarL